VKKRNSYLSYVYRIAVIEVTLMCVLCRLSQSSGQNTKLGQANTYARKAVLVLQVHTSKGVLKNMRYRRQKKAGNLDGQIFWRY
jgi:hypothetical protein